MLSNETKMTDKTDETPLGKPFMSPSCVAYPSYRSYRMNLGVPQSKISGWLAAPVCFRGFQRCWGVYCCRLQSRTSSTSSPCCFLALVPIVYSKDGDPEEAWKGSFGQVVQACQGEGLPCQSCFQVDPVEQEVWLPREEQGLVGSLRCARCMLHSISIVVSSEAHGK